jgi:hypothetical protein
MGRGITEYALEIKFEKYSNLENSLLRFEVSTAVTMKNAVFCDIKAKFVHHRRHITSPLQSQAC